MISLMRSTERRFYRAEILARMSQSKHWKKQREKLEKDLAWIYNLIMNSK